MPNFLNNLLFYLGTSFDEKHPCAPNCKYDKKNHLWCELTFALPMNLKNMDLTAVLKQTAEKSVVSEVQNIKRAITYMKDGKDLMLKTDGINVSQMFQNCDLVDVNRLYSNDIHKIAETYGIEAARRVIVKVRSFILNSFCRLQHVDRIIL